MEWYDIGDFKHRLEIVEDFLIQLAANEQRVLALGFRYALTLPSAEAAMNALETFDEDVSGLKRIMKRMEPSLASELEQFDGQGQLQAQVALIALKLRMSTMSRPLPRFGILLFAMLAKSSRQQLLFGEEPVSLHRTIINIGRLRALTSSFRVLASRAGIKDDEEFTPKRLDPDKVCELINGALEELSLVTSIDPSQRNRLEGYLREAKREVVSASPSWPKIVGALVICASIMSGIADAPLASKNIRDAVDYILGRDAVPTRTNILPPPSQPEDEQLTEIQIIV